MVVLMAIIGVVVGVGVVYVALRPGPALSVYGGPPSVKDYDRPAASTGTKGIHLPAAFVPVAPASEPASARVALSTFLAAEIADLRADAPERSAESFALLDADTQRTVGSVAAWRQTRAERVVPERFDVVSERRTDSRVEVIVAASRTPSITPFRGLVAAETTEVWSIAGPAGGWRVLHGRPSSVEPKLPANGAATAAAKRWVDGAARCDRGIVDLQLETSLLGSPELSQVPCTAKGSWTAGDAVPVSELDDITQFVAAYGSAVGRWGRGVEVAQGDRRFVVVLGPVGQDWRVLGLLPSGGGA